MQPIQDRAVRLIMKAEQVLLPVATSFVEKACLAFGLAKQEALSLTLASEEILAYLCQCVPPEKELRLTCRPRVFSVEVSIIFDEEDFDFKAFNIATSPELDDQEAMEDTGLLIASRLTDRLHFFEEANKVRVVLIKEKAYPDWTEVPLPVVRPLEHFSIRRPDPEEIKLFVRLAKEYYAPPLVPASFAWPGKIVDMAHRGGCGVAIAVDEASHIGGGIFWRVDASRLVEFYGPYEFNQLPESGMARSLTESFLNAIARTRAIGVINRYPTPELDRQRFEPLGTVSLCCPGGRPVESTAYYRHLEEDPGFTVWAHPLLEPFLAVEYERLVFAREIRLVTDAGESTFPYSVFSANFDRSMDRVTFYPVWIGTDAANVLAAHVAAVLREGMTNLLFELDLGNSEWCGATAALLENGFQPRLVLPCAGRGDLVVFQHRGA